MFPLAVRTGGAVRALVFQLAVRARFAVRAVISQPAVMTGVALHAARFLPSVRATLVSSHSERATIPRAHASARTGKSWSVSLLFGFPRTAFSSQRFLVQEKTLVPISRFGALGSSSVLQRRVRVTRAVAGFAIHAMASRSPSVAGAEAVAEPPPEAEASTVPVDENASKPQRVDFSGHRAWLPRADTRLSRVLGTALRDAGFAVYGTRAGGEELPFATETFVASTELHNPSHELTRRSQIRKSHLVVVHLPGDAGEIRALANTMTDAFHEDGKVRSLIVVSPPSSCVAGVGVGSGQRNENDSLNDASSISTKKGKQRQSAERTALRLSRPGILEVTIIRHGILYGEGEFADGFLSVFKKAWEGEPVPVFGTGLNQLKTTHAHQLAEAVLRVSARVFFTQEVSIQGTESSGVPRVVSVCDTEPRTQIEIAASIAKKFKVPLRRFHPSRAFVWDCNDARVTTQPHFTRFIPGLNTLEDCKNGVESLLLRFEDDEEVERARVEALEKANASGFANSELGGSMRGTGRKQGGTLNTNTGSTLSATTDRMGSNKHVTNESSDPAIAEVSKTFASSVASYLEHFPDAARSETPTGDFFTSGFGSFLFQNVHRGGMGEPVELWEELTSENDEKYVDTERKSEAEAPEGTPVEDEATEENTEEETLWELAPIKVGGSPAIFNAFLSENGLEPVRCVMHGPPLSRVDALAVSLSDKYKTQLLTPQSLVRKFLPKCDREFREKCGDPSLAEETDEGEQTGKEKTDQEEGAAPEQLTEPEDPEVVAQNLAAAELKADADALVLLEGLDTATKTELLGHALSTPEVEKFGYVLSNFNYGLIPDVDVCHSLFTHVPDRPLLRLKEGWDKPPEVEGDGGDGETAADAGDDGDAAPVEPPEPPEYPEETEDEAELRRVMHSYKAPNLVLRLTFNDGGVYTKQFKKSDPEGYAKFVEWATAEDAALDAYEQAVEAREEAEKTKKQERAEKIKAAKESGEEYQEDPEDPANAPEPEVEPVETDEVSKWLHLEKKIKRVNIEASNSDSVRVRECSKAFGNRARNFSGFNVDPCDDPFDRNSLELAMDFNAKQKELEEQRAERNERAAVLVNRRNKELELRETEQLHQRSASLRRYLAENVMPVVTDAIVTLSRLRPSDPVESLGEYLLRLDKKNEEEYEASRLAEEVMERALLEEMKIKEKHEKLAMSRLKAKEAQARIKPRSVVRKSPVMPSVRRTVSAAGVQKSTSFKGNIHAEE